MLTTYVCVLIKEGSLPRVTSSLDAAACYEALLGQLWECWSQNVSLPHQETPHTFFVSDKVTRVAILPPRIFHPVDNA
eukprot:scaffold259828_cov22-Prasinocladus_malaysianus.AAC.1